MDMNAFFLIPPSSLFFSDWFTCVLLLILSAKSSEVGEGSRVTNEWYGYGMYVCVLFFFFNKN